MNDLLLEIDDELRARQIKALWAKYGQTLIGLAVLTVFAVAVGAFWHNYVTSKLTYQTGTLLAAMDTKDAKSIEKAAADADMPLQAVALFYAAQQAEAKNDLKAAELNYKNAAENAREKIWHDLATFHVVRLGILQDKDPKDLIGRIDPLTRDGAPFRASALEMKALLLQKLGKKDEANTLLEALSTDGAAPNTIRQRARALKQE